MNNRFRWLAVTAAVATVVGFSWRVRLQGRHGVEHPPRLGASTQSDQPHRAPRLFGSVTGRQGPLPKATIRWQGHDVAVVSDHRGEFALPIVEGGVRLAASAEGHFIATVTPHPHEVVHIHLEALPSKDDASYEWVDPAPSVTAPHNCGNCHERIHTEWRRSAHARSATNPRLRDLIEGRDADGEPEPDWHMRRDHPHGVAVCNACHAPTLEPTDRHWEFPSSATGTAAAGVHCDFCHKVQAVDVSRVGLTHGRYGMRLLRPADGRPVVFGPLDDAERADTAAAAVYGRSEYCASCHEGTIFGIQAYSTYGEWLRSPAGRAGQQCQDCHMAATAAITNMAPGHGGIERDASTLSDHSLVGAATPRYADALVLTLETRAAPQGIEAILTLDASRIGHAVPTGFIDRHLALLIDATDGSGDPVPVLDGPRIPDWTGTSLAGRSGTLFAKLLSDPDGRLPAPLWNAAETSCDTRLDPNDPRTFRFLLTRSASRLRVRLLHRDFWETMRRRKKWADDTTVILDAECDLPSPRACLLPRPSANPWPGHGSPAEPR